MESWIWLFYKHMALKMAPLFYLRFVYLIALLLPLIPPITMFKILWNLPLLQSLFPPNIINAILFIPLQHTLYPDQHFTPYTKSDLFTTKCAFRFLTHPTPNPPLFHYQTYSQVNHECPFGSSPFIQNLSYFFGVVCTVTLSLLHQFTNVCPLCPFSHSHSNTMWHLLLLFLRCQLLFHLTNS